MAPRRAEIDWSGVDQASVTAYNADTATLNEDFPLATCPRWTALVARLNLLPAAIVLPICGR